MATAMSPSTKSNSTPYPALAGGGIITPIWGNITLI